MKPNFLKLKLTITIPTKEEIITAASNKKIPKPRSEGKKLPKNFLENQNKSGVYILFSKKKKQLLYIGKATGKNNSSQQIKRNWGEFKERIRRHLVFSNSKSKVYKCLSIKSNQPVSGYFIDLDKIEKMIRCSSKINKRDKAHILEQTLIGFYRHENLIND